MKRFLILISFILLPLACEEDNPEEEERVKTDDASDVDPKLDASDVGPLVDASDVDSLVDASGVDPKAACEDLAGVIADTSERCNDVDRESAYRSYLELAVAGDCSHVVDVRDETALYQDCLPAMQTIDCSAFATGNLPGACVKQLIIYDQQE